MESPPLRRVPVGASLDRWYAFRLASVRGRDLTVFDIPLGRGLARDGEVTLNVAPGFGIEVDTHGRRGSRWEKQRFSWPLR